MCVWGKVRFFLSFMLHFNQKCVLTQIGIFVLKAEISVANFPFNLFKAVNFPARNAGGHTVANMAAFLVHSRPTLDGGV